MPLVDQFNQGQEKMKSLETEVLVKTSENNKLRSKIQELQLQIDSLNQCISTKNKDIANAKLL